MSKTSSRWLRLLIALIAVCVLVASSLYGMIPPAQAQTIVTTINVGQRPDAIAVNHLTNRIYVGSYGSQDITVINGDSNTVATTFPYGAPVQAIEINPRTNRLYASNYSTTTVLSPDTGAVLGRIDQSLSHDSELAINTQTNRLYLCDWAVVGGQADHLHIYDGNTNALIKTIGFATSIYYQKLAVAVNEATNMVYVAYSYNDRTYFIDGASNAIVNTISVGVPDSDLDIAVDSQTNRVYVKGAANVTVLDGSSGARVGQIPGEWDIEVNSAANRVYLFRSKTFQILDGSTLGVLYSMQLPYTITGGGINAATNRVYLLHEYNDKLTIVQDDLLHPSTMTATRTRIPTFTRTTTRTPASTATPTLTPSPTATRTPTATPFPTPIGGWPASVFLPVMLMD